MAEWKVRSLTAYPHLDGKDNVVYLVHWELGLLDAVTELLLPTGNFIPFDGLTEDVVLGWVWEALGDQKAEIEANLTAKVEKQLNPTTANGMPWE